MNNHLACNASTVNLNITANCITGSDIGLRARFLTGAALTAIGIGDISMSQSQESLDNLADAYVHGLLSPQDTTKFEKKCEEKEEYRQALEQAKRRLQALQLLTGHEPSESVIQGTLLQIDTGEHQGRKRRRTIGWVASIALAASILILCGMTIHYSNLEATPTDLQVYGQTTLIPGTNASFRARLVHAETRQPIAGAPVKVELLNPGDDQHIELCSFITDEQGSGQPEFAVPDWADGEYQLRVTATAMDDDDVLARTVELRREAKLMLSSDKPLYQPGQTILVRALSLRQPTLKPMKETETTFQVQDPKGNIIFKKKTATSQFGIASMECPLATELIHGTYKITCTVGKTNSELNVTVKKYVLPKFKVNVKLDRPWYQPGDMVKGSVEAKYFFGKPVTIQQATLIGTFDTPSKQVFARQPIKTTEQGHGTFQLSLPRGLRSQKVSFHIEVTDSAGQKHGTSVSRPLAQKPLQVSFVPECGELVQGVQNTVYAMVTYPDGRPAKARIRFLDLRLGSTDTNDLGLASFTMTPDNRSRPIRYDISDDQDNDIQGTWQLPLLGGVGDFLMRPDRAVYNGGDDMHLTFLGNDSTPIFVDILRAGQTIHTSRVELTDGKGQLDIDLSPEWQGVFQLCAYRLTNDGMLRKTRTFFIRSANQVQVKANLDKKEYRPGQTAKIDLTLTDANGQPVPGAISLAAVDEAVFSVNASGGNLEQRFFLLEQELLRPVYQFYPWTPGLEKRLPEGEVRLLEQAAFATTVSTARQARPQTTTTQNWGADDEVMSEPVMMAPPSPGQRRVSSANPFTLQADTFASKKVRVRQEKEAGLQRVVTGTWGVIGLMLIGGYLCLWWFFPAQKVMVGHLLSLIVIGPLTIFILFGKHGLGNNATDTFEFVGSSAGAAGGETARNLVDAPAMDIAPPPSSAVDVEKPEEGPGQGRPAPRVREWFPETLLWQPQIVTDNQGRATLDLTLADSITSWRLSASAVTSQGQLGGSQSDIKVFQPFFVDVNLPVSLTRGDEITIPVVVYNYLKEKQTIDLTLKDADWLELLDGQNQKVEVDANGNKSVGYRVRVKKVGNHKLTIQAQTPQLGDAIIREIEVVPDGRKVEIVDNGSLETPIDLKLTVPEEAIEGSAKTFIKLYPSMFSQLLEGLDNIFHMPHGCFEQTSSTTYPNVLALDYLQATGQSKPEIEAKARHFIHLGYQRLLSFEVNGGGFDWYGRPPANVTLTAYGLMEFQDMAKVHQVDPALIERTRNWLLSKRIDQSRWSSRDRGFSGVRQGADPDYAVTAYVAWAVFEGMSDVESEGAGTLRYLMKRQANDFDNPYELALTCNALLALDKSGKSASTYLDRLLSLQRASEDGKLRWWSQSRNQRTMFYGGGISGDVEATALGCLALMKAKRSGPSVRAALSWLVARKDGRGTWYSTQATVLALKALLMGTNKANSEPKERHIEILLGDKVKRTLKIPVDQAEVMQQIDLSEHLTTGQQPLRLVEKTKTGTGYQVVLRYHVPDKKAKARQDEILVKVNYDRTETTLNRPIRATTTVTNRQAKSVNMAIVQIPIPAGFAMSSQSVNELRSSANVDKFERRGSTVILYLRQLAPNRAMNLAYDLRPTMPVKVNAAGPRAYAYYNPSLSGSSQATQLIVR